MSKHTPGPWRYKPHSVDSNYMLIFCSSDKSEGDNLRGYCGEANARLIAAAPGLLKSCKAALETLEALQGGCTDSNDGSVEAITVWCPEVIDGLAAAIKAAEGEKE